MSFDEKSFSSKTSEDLVKVTSI